MSKFIFKEYFGDLKKGLNKFKSYIIVGTLGHIRTAMRMLAENGY